MCSFEFKTVEIFSFTWSWFSFDPRRMNCRGKDSLNVESNREIRRTSRSTQAYVGGDESVFPLFRTGPEMSLDLGSTIRAASAGPHLSISSLQPGHRGLGCRLINTSLGRRGHLQTNWISSDWASLQFGRGWRKEKEGRTTGFFSFFVAHGFHSCNSKYSLFAK